MSIRYIPIKDTTECSTSASYLDVLLKLDTNGKLTPQLYMINGTISISPSSTSLTYVVIFQPHLCMVCRLYIATYSLCKSLLGIRSVFTSRQTIDKEVDVTRVSNVSLAGSFLQIVWSLQWYYLPIQPFFGPHAAWYVKPFLTLILTTVHTVYLIWKKGSRRVWSIDRGCSLLHGTWFHLWYIQRSVCAHSLICTSYWIYEIEYCSLFLSFHYNLATSTYL
jgi:hypothetical protein